MDTLHFFTADGRETTEGAADSVVQYTESDAIRRGLTLKKASPAPDKPEPVKTAAPSKAKAK